MNCLNNFSFTMLKNVQHKRPNTIGWEPVKNLWICLWNNLWNTNFHVFFQRIFAGCEILKTCERGTFHRVKTCEKQTCIGPFSNAFSQGLKSQNLWTGHFSHGPFNWLHMWMHIRYIIGKVWQAWRVIDNNIPSSDNWDMHI